MESTGLIRRTSNFNETPQEILQTMFAKQCDDGILTPMLKADFQLVEIYQYDDFDKFDCVPTVFDGTLDPDISTAELASRSEHFQKTSNLHMIEGGHFFIKHNGESLIKKLRQSLLQHHRELV